MIFKKIFTFLILSLIYNCESHHRCKRGSCGCSAESTYTAKNSNNNNKTDKNDELRISNPKEPSIENKKLNNPDVNKNDVHESTIPLQNYALHVMSEESSHLDPLGYTTNDFDQQRSSYINMDPSLSETLLKNMWLSYQLGNSNIPQVQSKYPVYNLNFNPETLRFNNPSQSPFSPKEEDYFKNLNDYLNKIDESQYIEPRELKIFNAGFEPRIDNYDDDIVIHSGTDTSFDSDSREESPQTILYKPGWTDMSSSLSLGEFKYKFPYDNNINIHNVNKREHAPPLRGIPRSKFGVDEQQRPIPKHPKIFTYNDLGYRDGQNEFDNLQENYYVPNEHKYDPTVIPNTNPIYNGYDLKNNDKQKGRYPIYPQSYENFSHNFPHNHDPNKIFEEQQYHKPATHIVPNRFSHKRQEPGKYRKWVLEQIESLNSKNQLPDKVDLSGLGYSILQILGENGMYVSDNGMVVDTDGTTSSIHTLSLTPIIIGNTMSLRHLLEGKYGVMSSKLHTPYLQAILVTAEHPQKVLGIMPYGTTYLPLSILSKVTNIWNSIPQEYKVKNSLKNELVLENRPQGKPNYVKDDKLYVTDQSTKQNVGGNRKSFLRMHPLTEISSRRGLTGPENDKTDDRPYSKKFIIQEDLVNNPGRIFIPRVEFQSIDKIARRQNSPVTVSSKYYEPARVHLPSLSSFLDILFKSEESSGNIVKNTQESAARISNSPAIADVVVSVPSKVDLSLERQAPNKIYKIITSTEKPVIKFKKIHTIPLNLDYLDFTENAPDYIVPVEEVDVQSRSGVEHPEQEIPPENTNDGNSAFDLIENEDDDDGDFRIIGGNAATGSGTPLSNKGRSGYIF